MNLKPANSDADEIQDLENDDEEEDDDDMAGQSSDVDPNEDVDPNHEHLSAHTKSLIAHLASLPGFGKTQARLSYVPYTGPEPAGSTLAELQLPWRSPISVGGTVVDGGVMDEGLSPPAVHSQVHSTSSTQSLQSRPTSMRLHSSANKTVSLDRRRGTNKQLIISLHCLDSCPLVSFGGRAEPTRSSRAVVTCICRL